MTIVPIGQAEDVLLKPNIYFAFDQAVCHGNDTISLRAKRIFAPQLPTQAGELKPIP